ncbi:MAG: hypothetical protein GTN93_13880, partial [Anaerolineae bacterium]|nr:hypothetical protein [Anaerolineae bacterium]
MRQSTPRRIPLTKPFLGQEEMRAVQETLAAREITGNGPKTRACEEEIERIFGVKHAYLTTSCTHAMELAMMCLHLAPG